jgi:hypothetical protein
MVDEIDLGHVRSTPKAAIEAAKRRIEMMGFEASPLSLISREGWA